MIIYEYIDGRGKGVITEWRRSLQSAERALLDQHLEDLEEFDDPSHLPGLFFGSRKKAPHIIKIKIGGKIRLRPMACRGPIDLNREVTILFAAVERDGKLVPTDAPERAEKRWLEIRSDQNRRRRYEPED